MKTNTYHLQKVIPTSMYAYRFKRQKIKINNINEDIHILYLNMESFLSHGNR